MFGARGTGKTTWLEAQFKKSDCLWINLLDEEDEKKYSRRPGLLDAQLTERLDNNNLPKFVIIDEVQKVPKLLDIAQKWIHKKKVKFILTGSSARKLKKGAANLLGGRANSYSLFPFTARELGSAFDLQSALNWGTLPELVELKTEREKRSYLRSYCSIYLKEEILQEQLIRKLPPFREFLEVLAQHNGKLLNFESLARDVGVDHKTIASYIEILQETYLGVLLRPHHPSLRKSQLQQPKFYFFDLGVQRDLAGWSSSPLMSSTSAYGEAFESWLIQEIYRLNLYFEYDYRLSFYRSKHGAEVDLILTRGNEKIWIEIKSTSTVDPVEVAQLSKLTKEFSPQRVVYLSQDPKRQKIHQIECLPYMDFLSELVRVQKD